MNLQMVSFLVFLMNIPCGYMRARSERLSRNWFMWVHIPIPFVVALRIFCGLGFHLYTFPIMVSSYFLGQFIGGQFALHLAKAKDE